MSEKLKECNSRTSNILYMTKRPSRHVKSSSGGLPELPNIKIRMYMKNSRNLNNKANLFFLRTLLEDQCLLLDKSSGIRLVPFSCKRTPLSKARDR